MFDLQVIRFIDQVIKFIVFGAYDERIASTRRNYLNLNDTKLFNKAGYLAHLCSRAFLCLYLVKKNESL